MYVLAACACFAATKLPPVTALPHDLPFVESPRPWGESFLPKSNAPGRRLLTIKLSALRPDERVAVTCLQALTARTQPVLWITREAVTERWLDWHTEKGHIDGCEPAPALAELFKRFAGAYKGAIVPDDKLHCGVLLAINVASAEDLIVASPKVAQELNLPIKVDLRGRFTTFAEGLEWVWSTYKDRLNRHVFNYKSPKLVPFATFDYDMQWRCPLVWISGTKDGDAAGADQAAEIRVVAKILSEMAANGVVTGFPAGGEGEGIGEVRGVELASRYAKGLVCTNHTSNLSVFSGVRIDALRQPRQAAAPALEKDKVYIAMVMSDGDNLNCWQNFFRRYFEHPSFGKFPLAFGMGPPIREMLPGVAQWYFEHATPVTEFIADVSGVAYMQPDNYAAAYADRNAVYDGFVGWTKRQMQALEMRTMRTVGGKDDSVTRFAAGLPFCHSMFADMGRYSGRSGIENLTYTLPDGMPVFRAVTSWRYGKEGFLREIREQVGSQRPAFVNGFVHCWTFTPDDVAKIYAERDADMVFVTPAQLAELYRQAKRN